MWVISHSLWISFFLEWFHYCEDRKWEKDAAAAKSLRSCLTLCSPIDCSPPASPVPGILQARTVEWVAISFSNAWKWKVKVKSLSRARLLATPWTAGYQAPPSMGFSRQEYWNGVPLPSPLFHLGFPNDSAVKNLPANAGEAGFISGSGRTPEKEMATCSSIVAQEIPRTETLVWYRSWGLQKLDTT